MPTHIAEAGHKAMTICWSNEFVLCKIWHGGLNNSPTFRTCIEAGHKTLLIGWMEPQTSTLRARGGADGIVDGPAD